MLVALVLAIPVVIEFARTGLVDRFPTLFLAFTFLLAGCLMLAAGLVLDGIRKSRHEQARLAYLQYPAVPGGDGALAVPNAPSAPEEVRSGESSRSVAERLLPNARKSRASGDRLLMDQDGQAQRHDPAVPDEVHCLGGDPHAAV